MNIPLKQPTNFIANNPTICVDHMKHYLYYTFLSLFLLSGCGGGGGGTSSSGGSSSKKPQSCALTNGSGHKVWDKTAKKYSTTCTLVTCNAGYDHDANQAQCGKTPAGFYSLAKDKTRRACPTPSDSSAIASTGLSSAGGCYNCDGGYLKNTASNTCDVPGQGKYVNVGGTEASCNPIAIEGGATATWIAGAAATETACPFSCSAGFVKNEVLRSCNIPEEGKYVKNGAEAACDPITGVNGVSQFTKSTGGVSSATTCPFSCGAGYVKSDRSCNVPGLGKYADAGIEKSCDDPRGTVGGLETFLINTKGVSSATGCNFSCKQNHVKSVSEYSCKEGQTCSIANGAGFKATPSDPCRVVDCNAGYDNTQAPTTQCQQTASGHYSLANNKGRTTCSVPPHSSATTTTGLSSAESCYTCTSGYLKNTVSNTCDVPSKGTYVNVGGTEASCNTITIEGGAIATWITGAASTEDSCPFSCSTGYAKTGRACNIPGLGKYADNSGDEQSCNNPTGAAAGFDVFLPNMGAVSTATGCGFSCKSGFVKNRVNRTCNTPGLGKYADGSGNELSCDNPTGATGGFKEFLTNTAAVATATGCNFSCNVGFVKNTADSMCEIPDLGKYADSSGDEQTCDNPTGATGGFKEFLPNTAAVSTATGCGFSCKSGYVKDAPARTCNFPSTGNYVNAQGTVGSCNSNSITTEGTATATWIAGAASAANTCPFSCSAGYVVDTSTPKCKYPTQGTYADAQGAEVSCTDIMSMTGFGSWVSGAATDADSCPFSCASGYTVSGRTCRQPKTLALGQDTSRVLFDNGEVEAWGKVSTLPWRSHIKENLGNNTPQAFVSGAHHQCIILKNGNLNHGRLMCWGANDEEQLGVGDTNPRTTPTPVGHTILGDTGDGATPKTVKSVAAGGAYTCAILNDDTVVCWGRNNFGQIGGSAAGTNKTISGTTAGDPLNGGTASRIAAGGAHTCAVLSDNSVQCWGYNRWGQTGGGTPSLGAGKTATEIATGGAASCAILNDGSVKCWGYTGIPNLGAGKTATEITLGEIHGCAILNDKTVKCWGSGNAHGELGGHTANSGRVLRGTLRNPLGGQAAIQIAAGSTHTCAIMESDNSVKCWGRNVDASDTGFYGQIVGGVAMTGGTDGTGTSMGETARLTAVSTPTATALETDDGGKVCKITLSGGGLSNPWILKNYSTPLTYNTGGGSIWISSAIDNMIAAIGSTVKLATTDVVLSKKGNFKIEATVNSAVFEGMTLTIFHDDNAGDCTTGPVGTPITLSGASGGDKAEGLWIISEDYSGSGDKTINLDSVHIDLGTSNLTKEEIADKIVADVGGASWAGKQYKDLPYLATKLDGGHDTGDDCPDSAFCVVFERLFKGTEGNYGIPFGDRDYEH